MALQSGARYLSVTQVGWGAVSNSQTSACPAIASVVLLSESLQWVAFPAVISGCKSMSSSRLPSQGPRDFCWTIPPQPAKRRRNGGDDGGSGHHCYRLDHDSSLRITSLAPAQEEKEHCAPGLPQYSVSWFSWVILHQILSIWKPKMSAGGTN